MKLDRQLVDEVKQRVKQFLPDVVDLRHRIHSEPEVGLDTSATAEKIRRMLGDTSLVVREPLLGHDVVADLEGGSGRVICLRADIDALPICEENDLPYKSTIPNTMHACGHDGHAAMLVGAALVLDSLRERLGVRVRFVFQPGEEVICAGREMVARGAVDGCEAAYAIHGWPGVPEGAVSTRQGPLFAAGAHFYITLRGRGCHGAMPERGRNPIPPAARVACELQEMHDELHPLDGTVVSVCSLQAGSSSNIIPDSALVQGTARYLSLERGDEVEGLIRGIAARVAADAGVEVDIDYIRHYDLPVVNSRDGFERVRYAAQVALPAGCWIEAEQPTMANEDFAYYLQGRDGAMMWLGLGEEYQSLHSLRFDFNDRVLNDGILVFSLLALSYGQE